MPLPAALDSTERTRKPPGAKRLAGNGVAKSPPAISKLVVARDAVEKFLFGQFDARAVRITKIGALPDGGVGWQAEAEILVPDLAIRTLGLPLTQEILEKECCAVELDADLAVKSYEFLDPGQR